LFYTLLFCALSNFYFFTVAAQTIRDSSGNKVAINNVNDKKIDSVLLLHSPRKAAIRSAILPGWGQAYNKKYWKIPLVYGALGTSAGIFIFNIKNYRDYRFAYRAKFNASLPTGQRDSTDYFKIRPELLPLDLQSLRYGRDEYRRNVDYSVLVFVLLWGLNVVDATVDAHLKSFDVSPDLSFKIKPGYSELGGTHGLSLVLAFK
jgi:hypothetical protein